VAFRSVKMRTFAERTATYRENSASKSSSGVPARGVHARNIGGTYAVYQQFSGVLPPVGRLISAAILVNLNYVYIPVLTGLERLGSDSRSPGQRPPLPRRGRQGLRSLESHRVIGVFRHLRSTEATSDAATGQRDDLEHVTRRGGSGSFRGNVIPLAVFRMFFPRTEKAIWIGQRGRCGRESPDAWA
jgi:hypothetical protein